jgi:cell division protein FtsL
MIFEAKAQPAALVLVFAAVCVMSAMALVYTKHESRKLFAGAAPVNRHLCY